MDVIQVPAFYWFGLSCQTNVILVMVTDNLCIYLGLSVSTDHLCRLTLAADILAFTIT